jgi:AraC-like DNA-binding protein/quercetin dioxygenase-like cupin family protein
MRFQHLLVPESLSSKITQVTKNSFSIRGTGQLQVTAVEACSALSFARHSHDEYGVGIMLAGAQRSWSGRGQVEACAGNVITVNPGEVHDGMAIGDSRKWAMLYLDTRKVASITADIHEGKRAESEFSAPVLQNRRAAKRFATTYSAHAKGNEDAMDEQLILLLAGLLGDTKLPKVGVSQRIYQVKQQIDDDPAGYHPLEDLARICGTSRFKTLRGFTAVTGLTPHAYIIQRRLELAKALIRSGVRLAGAGSEAGFADQSHFHRAFVRRFGMTPGVYAAAMR